MEKKKKVLIFAQYYPPDVAATGQILQDLAEGMGKQFAVTVLCAVPSYTGKIGNGYREKKIYQEVRNDVRIIRVPVPAFSKTDRISRVRNLLVYFINAKRVTAKLGRFDTVFAMSPPPLTGGLLGMYGKKKRGGKLVYCIQDFYPEVLEATGYIRNKALVRTVRALDNRIIRHSDLVITVGRDLAETLEKRFRGKYVPGYEVINNWIDEKAVCPLAPEDPGVLAFRKKYGLEGKFVFMYSGNIGLYYDLDGLMRVIGQFKDTVTKDGRKAVFAFVGDGSLLQTLKRYKDEQQLDNVVFIPYQEKEQLIYSLNAADVHLCVSAKGIRGVSVPSKFYGIAAAGKPVLAVQEAGAEVEALIRLSGCGRITEPGDYAGFAENIRWFADRAGSEELADMGMRGRACILRQCTKDASVGRYIEAIKRL